MMKFIKLPWKSLTCLPLEFRENKKETFVRKDDIVPYYSVMVTKKDGSFRFAFMEQYTDTVFYETDLSFIPRFRLWERAVELKKLTEEDLKSRGKEFVSVDIVKISEKAKFTIRKMYV